jgi:hypothetical protein
MHIKNKLGGLVLIGGVACAMPAQAHVRVQVPAILHRDAPIEDSVRAECNVGQLIGNGVFQKVNEVLKGDAAPMAMPETAGEDPFLKLTLVAVHGEGGSRLSGAKNVIVRVDLLVKGRIAATKDFMRGTSVMGSLGGTCSQLESIADALGKDIAKWLPGAIQDIPAALANAPLVPMPLAAKDDPTSPQSQVNQHRRHIPPATNFATIDNIDALPVNAAGRDNYRQYLSMPAPKAFVIYSNGRTRAYSNDPDAMANSLDTCVNEGKACWLYAVDDRIVWAANEGMRVGLSTRLKKK